MWGIRLLLLSFLVIRFLSHFSAWNSRWYTHCFCTLSCCLLILRGWNHLVYPKPCTVWPLLPLRPLLLFFWILMFQAYGLPVAPHPQCFPALFHHSFPGFALPPECTTFSGPLAAYQGTLTHGMGSPDLLNHSTRVSALGSGAAATFTGILSTPPHTRLHSSQYCQCHPAPPHVTLLTLAMLSFSSWHFLL